MQARQVVKFVLLVGLVAVLLFGGAAAWFLHATRAEFHNWNAQAYIKQVEPHAGYREIGAGSEGTCNCNLHYYYLGPSAVDPASIFTAPGLALTPYDAPPGAQGERPWSWELLLKGEGATDTSGPCRVYVSRHRRGHILPDHLELTAAQRSQWNAGEIEVLKFSVSCQRDHVR